MVQDWVFRCRGLFVEIAKESSSAFSTLTLTSTVMWIGFTSNRLGLDVSGIPPSRSGRAAMEKKWAAVHGEGFPSNYADNAEKALWFHAQSASICAIRVKPV